MTITTLSPDRDYLTSDELRRIGRLAKFLARVADYERYCVHGHSGCSSVEGGRCSDERINALAAELNITQERLLDLL